MTVPLLTDSHAHLDRNVYDTDREEVLFRAREAGVGTIVNIGLGPAPADFERAHQFTITHEGIFLAVGVHPHDVKGMTGETMAILRDYLARDRVVAVGEIGLDYHYDHSPREVQRRWFREMVELALEMNFPVIIHSREAVEDTYSILKEADAFRRVGGVLHCFGGNAEEAARFVELGAHIGFAGIVTFKKGHNVRGAAKEVPIDRILIETDAPFLAPEPFRGKRNEPAFVRRVAEVLAEIRGLLFEETVRVTTANSARLFRFPPASLPPPGVRPRT
ncbi:MAG: TatD family hydrolase [Pseudomonadota bacterium]